MTYRRVKPTPEAVDRRPTHAIVRDAEADLRAAIARLRPASYPEQRLAGRLAELAAPLEAIAGELERIR